MLGRDILRNFEIAIRPSEKDGLHFKIFLPSRNGDGHNGTHSQPATSRGIPIRHSRT